MTDTYQNWIERVSGGRTSKPLSPGEIVKSSSGEPFGVVEFVRIPKKYFVAEVGKKGNKYIYHFFPAPSFQTNVSSSMVSEVMVDGTSTMFSKALSKAFLEIFKREDQIEAEWVEEMKSWAVRVSGWTDHVWGDELALRVVEKVQEFLTEEDRT